MAHKKRQILAASLVAALALAVAVNWYYTKGAPEPDDAGSVTDRQVQGNLGDSLLVAGTAENSTDTQPEDTAAAAQTAAKAKQYFSDAKLRQSQYRDEVKDEIEALMESDKMDDAGKQKLLSMLSDFDTRQKQQTDCESLIKAKLGGECVVVISDDTAQVVVEPGTVNENTSLQIAEIVAKAAKITADNLTIIEAKESNAQR